MQFIEIRPGRWRRLEHVHRAGRRNDGAVELCFSDGEVVTVDESIWLAAIGAPASKSRPRKAA